MTIYRIKCLIDGKEYVGQTTMDICKRWERHKKCHLNPQWHSSRGACPKLYSAMRKYGIENFTIKSLDFASSTQELNKKELFWIKKLNTIEKGYNLCEGGNFGFLSKESRAKISRSKMGNPSNKGKKFSKETRKKGSIAKRGPKNPMYGKKAHNAKMILCISNGKVYTSIKEACDDLGADKRNISAHINGKRKHVNGYKFKYL
jgi:group I intron endonuclease